MEPEFITYQKFNDSALANDLAELLDGHNIPYFIQEETSGFDPSLVMSNAAVDYAVKIKSEDFEKVNQLRKEIEAKNIEGVDKDHYLFGFTDDELMEVLIKADEWSTFDVVLARKILAERGKNISDVDMAVINEKRIEELRVPETSQSTWIILGYIFALLGGIIGLFIGWHLKSHKKTLPDGEKVYAYTEQDRWHGKIIFYIAIVGTTVGVIYKLWPAFQNN
ncbi:MAG TPA: hypothetical protein VK671_16115 [Mucilaginibacter sp.]|nr:hypothetical protein [Mucilaginibacter sp.]